MSQPIYNKGRFPALTAKGLCRGCHKPVPPPRKTWCSKACFDRFHPDRVKYKCFERDHGICAACGADTDKLKRRLKQFPNGINVYERRFWSDGVFDRVRYKLACEIFIRRRVRLYDAFEKRRRRMYALGWPTYACMKWWQMDHIVPFSEGGLTVIENVQSLCILCHRTKSKREARERADRRRLLKSGKATDQNQIDRNMTDKSHSELLPPA